MATASLGGEIPVLISGWLTIVWNDQPHYFLGTTNLGIVELEISEDLLREVGGALALDRVQVEVEGHWEESEGERLQVSSLQVMGE